MKRMHKTIQHIISILLVSIVVHSTLFQTNFSFDSKELSKYEVEIENMSKDIESKDFLKDYWFSFSEVLVHLKGFGEVGKTSHDCLYDELITIPFDRPPRSI